ncbi:MAG TPA: DUF2905 domain-containing protein [Anaerolineales bacterium]|nr:DUF2905 domain-containing protein [Anaerolineae bacterium]HIQ02251.1 DUF2905 domain-containing protein [Anaerolineales bacterium]
MEGMELVGKMLIFGGLTMTVVGGLLWLLARLPGLGDLPGTIRIERPGFTCIVPVLASIVLSILLTVVLNVIVRLLNR